MDKYLACAVYRLVSERTMEERMVQRAQKKLFLDAMVRLRLGINVHGNLE